MVKLGDLIRWGRVGAQCTYLVVQEGKDFKLLALDGGALNPDLMLWEHNYKTTLAIENGYATIIGNYFDIPNK